MSSAPLLADITVNGQRDQGGRACRASRRSSTCSIASPASRCGRSKSGRCRSPTCPGEKTSPTQPFPTKPPAYARNYHQGAGRSDRLHAGAARAGARAAEALQVRADRRSRRRCSATSTGILGAIDRHVDGGTNWPGAALRSGDAHRLRAGAATRASRAIAGRAADRSSRTSATCRASAGQPFREVLGPGDCCAADAPQRPRAAPAPPRRRRGAPRRRPPPRRRPSRPRRCRGCRSSSRRTACSRRSISIAASSMWQVPHGDTPDNVRNHPGAARA